MKGLHALFFSIAFSRDKQVCAPGKSRWSPSLMDTRNLEGIGNALLTSRVGNGYLMEMKVSTPLSSVNNVVGGRKLFSLRNEMEFSRERALIDKGAAPGPRPAGANRKSETKCCNLIRSNVIPQKRDSGYGTAS
ncbi:hypothetical protein EVAR_69424_1 [Eumeta japonica]|uniref:Uncharacterized protein n=1 Tax=Eumeta variegata TaxID=151549 RepID=A0A4C1ZAL0_EUMVA|nr:hypothetical protein EVAR_69424_1 [Eumeta japonica]